jgi:hypothetical protein
VTRGVRTAQDPLAVPPQGATHTGPDADPRGSRRILGVPTSPHAAATQPRPRQVPSGLPGTSSGRGCQERLQNNAAPDEWYVCVEVRELAVLRDGRRAPRGTASRNLCHPCCFRDSSEIRPRTTPGSAAPSTRRGASRWLVSGAGCPGLRCRGGRVAWPMAGAPAALRAVRGPRPRQRRGQGPLVRAVGKIGHC